MYKKKYNDSAKYRLLFGLMATVWTVNNSWGQAGKFGTDMHNNVWIVFVSQQLQSWRQRESLTLYLTNIRYRICSLVTSYLQRKQHKNNRPYQQADLRRTRKLNKIKAAHPPLLVPRNSLFYNWSRWCDRIISYCSLKTVSVHQPLFINEEGALVE